LLVEWLNAVLCEMDIRKILFGKFEVKIEGDNLFSKCWGECIDVQKHQPAVEVKAATYCQLKVERRSDGIWTAQCVVDV
ncbi:MAG: archease, partial [Limisphaerales bacterium]